MQQHAGVYSSSCAMKAAFITSDALYPILGGEVSEWLVKTL
jgi:hypothetical protein